MKFVKHKINALNRVKAGANDSKKKKYLELSRSAHHYQDQRYDTAKLGKIANTSPTPNHVL